MSKVGFGAYRISIQSEDHENALRSAMDHNVTLIDTSSNYTDGDSEKLIGKVLKDYEHKPIIISKVGYVQGKNLEILEELKESTEVEDIVNLSSELKHCIHPVFIEDQIKRSLERLELESIDVYLLHNPEYYLKSTGATKKEYYQRIKKAFEKMEELVERGLIKYYGISSNTFPDPKDDEHSTNLDIVFGAARDITINHHFKYIQFPLNVLEMGALERQFDGNHLIEQAQLYGLKTIINRPLNSFTDHGLLRLAIYAVDEMYEDEKNAEILFNKLIQPLVIKWLEVREDDQDKLFDIPLMKQISNMWYKQFSQDGVEQIFFGYFFPLIANIYGRDLEASESQNYYQLFEHALEFAKVNMNKRASQFEEKALNQGLLFEKDIPLTHKVIEKYISFGIDYILVGMRKKDYVDDLKEYF